MSILLAGMFVPIPEMTHILQSFQYLSMHKYNYQAILLLFFKGNTRTRTSSGMLVEDLLEGLHLTIPPTVQENWLVAGGLYCIFAVGALISLTYFHRER